MKRRTTTLALFAVSLLCVAPRAATAPQAQGGPASRATCVLTNPAYSGKCTVTEEIPKGGTPQSACKNVLTCLNNTQCLKTYCQATTVRTGWQLESAAAEK